MKTFAKNFMAVLTVLALLTGFAMGENITPIRTDVAGFSEWTDTNIGGTTYLQLLIATAVTISPAMNFDNYTDETLDFKARTYGGTNTVENEITVSISIDNGANWTVLGTRTPLSSTMTAMTQFDLSSYSGTQVKVKFTVAGTNSIGAGIDDITIAGIIPTSYPEPSNYPTSFVASGVSYTIMSLNWSDNDGAQAAGGFLIKASSTSLVAITAPSDGTAEADDANLGDGSAVVNVAHGTETYQFTGLNAGTTYYFKIWPYTNLSTNIDYKTDGTVPTVTQATIAAPAPPSLIISEVADPDDDYLGRFVEVFNTSTSTIDFSSTTVYFARQANGGSWASIQLTGTLASETALVIGIATSIDATYGHSTCDVNFTSVTGNGDDGYFLYVDGDETSGLLFDAYGVVDEDGTGKTWEYEDSRAVRKSSINTPNATWTASEWTITSANVADMNPGTHSVDTPLPITLASFTATAVNGTVELAWETATETNNARFVIYRNDVAIGSVDGAGTTSEPHHYSFVDDAVVPGVTYTYVLADVDLGNKETKYTDEAVTVTVANDLVEVDFIVDAAYPNPFNPSVAISYQLSASDLVKASIYNSNGILVKELLNKNMTAGSHELVWNAANMPSGVYILKMSAGNTVNTQKLVLSK